MVDKFAVLQAYVATVEEGGFSAAARRLALAASSVTRRVDQLEGELGATLLNRSTRSVTLTAAGEAYFQHARALLRELEIADDEVRNLDSEPRGWLRLVAPATFGRLHILPLILEFMTIHPSIKVQLNLSDSTVNLFEQDVDLAVRIGRLPTGESLMATRLAPHRRRIVASPSYLALHGEPRHPSELSQRATLLFDYSNVSSTWHLARRGRTTLINLTGTLCANDSQVLLKAAINNLGIALLADWLVAPSLASGELVTLFDDYEANPHEGTTDIWLLYPENRKRVRKVQLLVDHLKQRYPGSS